MGERTLTALNRKSIEEKAKSKAKREVFRQTRHANDLERLRVMVDGAKAELKNWSRTGIGLELSKDSKRVYAEGDRIKGVHLVCGDVTLYEGEVEIRSVRAQDDGKHFYGASFASSLFLVEGVESAVAVNECASGAKSLSEMIEKVDPGFCQSVLALSCILRHVQQACAKEENRWKNLNFDQRCEAERIFLPNIVRKVREGFVHFNVKISSQIEVEGLPEDSIYHRIFHEEVYPYFQGADLIRRAYEKPRGYAGDYEMMNQIYRNGFEGVDLFGRVLHHYITNENSAESVKFRRPYFINKYQQAAEQNPNGFSALSVACGPAIEVQELVRKWDQDRLQNVEFTLFDLDREALEHAQTKIYDIAVNSGKRPNVSFINASVKSFLASNQETREKFDLIYSGGLFDYLDNLTSSALVRKFASMLNPGGTLVIGNFTKENLTKAFLHLLTKWTLIHKTEAEMRNWATGIDGCAVTIEFDSLKMNAFLVLKRHAR